MVKNRDSHHWTEPEDTIVYYVTKFGTNGLGMTEEEIAKHIGVSTETLEWRYRNHTGEQKSTKTIDLVHRKCGHLDAGEFRKVVLPLLDQYPQPAGVRITRRKISKAHD